MRVYVSLPNPSYLRNLEPVVRVLLERGHHIVLGIREQQERGGYLQTFVDSVDVKQLTVTAPPLRVDRMVRWLPLAIDYLFFLGPEFEEVPYSRLKRGRKIHEFVRQLMRKYRLRYGWRRRAAMAWLRFAEEAIAADAGLIEHFRHHHPDLLLISPLLDSHTEQYEHLRAAKALGIPTVHAVHSWDNLTSKGLVRMRPEGIAVWNKVQEREAVELHGQRRKRVLVTGAYNFDDWFVARPSADRASFLRRVGLPTDRAVILYLCSALYFPQAQPEEAFIVEWLAKLRQSDDRRLREAAVMVRPHPKRLQEFSDPGIFGGDPAVKVWPNQGELPVGGARQETFFDSLYHADAVVALNTTAIIDAAIVGRPVHTILDSRHRFSQEMTLHFNYLTDPEFGVLRVAPDWTTHFSQLSESLTAGPDAERVKSFVAAFVRPHGLDQACAPRFADSLESLARSRKVIPLPGVWLRPIALPCLKLMAWSAERVDKHVKWKRVQTLADWQQRRIFLAELRARAKA